MYLVKLNHLSTTPKTISKVPDFNISTISKSSWYGQKNTSNTFQCVHWPRRMFDYIKYFAMRQKEENLSCMEFLAFWWFLKRKHQNTMIIRLPPRHFVHSKGLLRSPSSSFFCSRDESPPNSPSAPINTELFSNCWHLNNK